MSQGNVSDLTSTVSSVTDTDGSDHVNNNFTHVENPKGQRCIHCASSWKHLTATTMKAHLSNVKFSKEYMRGCWTTSASTSISMMRRTMSSGESFTLSGALLIAHPDTQSLHSSWTHQAMRTKIWCPTSSTRASTSAFCLRRLHTTSSAGLLVNS